MRPLTCDGYGDARYSDMHDSTTMKYRAERGTYITGTPVHIPVQSITDAFRTDDLPTMPSKRNQSVQCHR